MRRILRKTITALGALLVALAVTAGEPNISFTELTHDFGNIAEDGGPVSYAFNFSNDGDAPLVIVSATAQCGCTRPAYTKRPLEAGESSEIKVTYLPEGRPGEFSKEVKVKTNDKNQKIVRLRITGVVIPAKKQ